MRRLRVPEVGATVVGTRFDLRLVSLRLVAFEKQLIVESPRPAVHALGPHPGPCVLLTNFVGDSRLHPVGPEALLGCFLQAVPKVLD